MKQFKYKLLDANKIPKSGAILAENIVDARRTLTKDGRVVLLSLKQNIFYMEFGQSAKNVKVPLREVTNFTRELQMLLQAGMPLNDSLVIVRMLVKHRVFKKVIDRIVSLVLAGNSLSYSMGLYSNIFNNTYIAMVQAGETSGSLDKILLDINHLLEWAEELKRRLWAAVRYPVIVLTLGLGATIGVVKIAIPKFAGIFASAKTELPALTKALIKFSHYMEFFSLHFVLAIIGLFFLVGFLYSTTKFKNVADTGLFYVPVIGEVANKYFSAYFCKVFSILYGNGVSILQTLNICRQINANTVYQKDVSLLLYRLERGKSLSDAALETKIFSGIVAEMIGVGEKGSSLDVMLEKTSEVFTEDINYILDNIFGYIQPLFIVFLGGLVGSLIFGIVMPMMDMMTAMMDM